VNEDNTAVISKRLLPHAIDILQTHSTIALSESWHFFKPYAPWVEYPVSGAILMKGAQFGVLFVGGRPSFGALLQGMGEEAPFKRQISRLIKSCRQTPGHENDDGFGFGILSW
jgi:hypothetical protein